MNNKNKHSFLDYFTSIKPILNRFGYSGFDSALKKFGVHSLNIAQFFGVVNDNIFKLLIVYLFIDLYGVENSPQVLFNVGVIFVLPFLLFSNAAGVLADYFSKQKIIALLKAVEVGIMIVGMIAFWYKSTGILYFLLFLLSLQSAVMGPPKYSIIPELAPQGTVSKANGLITSWTYLGMIMGTFLASALTQITERNFVLVGLICLIMAIVGYIAGLCIPETPKNGGAKRRVNPFFFYEIYKTLKSCKPIPYLLTSIMMAAYFLFIGAFFQLNVIPFAIESLGMTEVGGGYLFLTTSIGIAIGAYIAGKLGRKKIELGLPAMSLCILTGLIFLLAIFSFHIVPVLMCLVLVGFFGGLMVVPLDTFVQTKAPQKIRAQVVAASNFMSFIGVLIAPITIKLFNGAFGLTAVKSFFLIGLVTFCVTLVIIRQFPHLFFNYVCRTLMNPFAGIKINNFPIEERLPVILIDLEYTWKHLAYLISHSSDLIICIPRQKRKWYHSLIKRFSSLRFVYYGESEKGALPAFLHYASSAKQRIPVLVITFEVSEEEEEMLEKHFSFVIRNMAVSTLSRKEREGTFKRAQVTIELSEEEEEEAGDDRNDTPWIPFQ